MTVRSRALPVLLFAFGLTTIALPLLGFRYVPTQDGPNHYNTAMVLAGLGSDARQFLERYFEVQPSSMSNQLAGRLMVWAVDLGFATMAERLVWLLLFTAFAAVVVGNLFWARREAVVFSLLLFPIFAGVLVNLGFINFLIGLVFFTQSAFLLQAGLHRPSTLWIASMLAAAAATFLAHPLTGLALGAVDASFAVAYLVHRLVAGRRQTDPSFSPLVPIGCVLCCLMLLALAAQAALPQIARFFSATANNVANGMATTATEVAPPDSLRERLIDVFGLSYFVSYSPADYLFSLGFGLVLAWLLGCWARGLWRRRSWRLEDSWLASIAVLLALAIVVPRNFEYFMPDRLVACLLIVVIIWLSSTHLSRITWRALLAAGILLNSGLLVWRMQWSETITAMLTEYASVAQFIPDETSLLSIRTSTSSQQLNCRAVRPRLLPCGFRPTLHFMSEIIGDRPIALLTNYQLRPDAGFFPIRLRAPWSDYTHLNASFERWPPPLEKASDLTDAIALVDHEPTDVIVTWDERRATGARPGLFPAAAAPIVSNYSSVFTSSPLGAATVYLRRSPAPRASR